jgi:phage shock protein A
MTGRVGRLISGSLNAVIDAAENVSPVIVMQESIREVEQAVAEVRHELGRVVVQQHMTQDRLKSEETRHQALQDQIAVALKENREDLAEAAISKQMDIEAQLPVLKRTLEDASKQSKELEGFIAALQAKKREMAEELNRFKTHSETSNDASAAEQVSKAEEAFNRVMGMNTTVVKTPDDAKLAELEALTRQNRIEERLRAMKAEQE